jgi:hypothetical protein
MEKVWLGSAKAVLATKPAQASATAAMVEDFFIRVSLLAPRARGRREFETAVAARQDAESGRARQCRGAAGIPAGALA